MINMNLNSKNNYPFLLRPSGKDYLWGGTRLKSEFNKQLNIEPLAETWECSTHPDGLSYVMSGEFEDESLKEVLQKHPEFLGTHVKTNGELPILIKFIDAKEDLSVQVHPDDSYARKYENNQLGKTEMWYVLEADKNTKLIHGFNCDVNKEILEEAINNKEIEKYLNKIDIVKDDLFFIKPGTIHAIGAGALIVEIQQNSNLTYRLYDYDRIDKNGQTRNLHIKKVLDVLDYKASNQVRQPIRVHNYKKGFASELLCRCEYFEVHKSKINTKIIEEKFQFKTQNNSFHVLLCIDGEGILSYDNETLKISKGNCIFVPANSCNIEIEGSMEFLNINC